MGELINGRTPEEIKAALSRCATGERCKSEKTVDCPYYVDCLLGIPRLWPMKHALALIEHLEAKIPRWIGVEERLPENDNLVLVRANGRAREIRWDGAYVLATYGSEGWVLWDYEDDEVQHLRILQWMPLPEPTNEDKHEAE